MAAHKEINRLEQTKTVPLAIDATAEPVPVAAELTNFANAEPQIGIGIGMLADAPLVWGPNRELVEIPAMSYAAELRKLS